MNSNILIVDDELSSAGEPRIIVSDILIRHESDASGPKPRDLQYYLRCAKRAINRREFEAAKRDLIRALDLDPKSLEALNLVSVMLEMREEHKQVGSSL